MIELLSEPALTMGIASVGGFLMKAKALENQRRHDAQIHSLETLKVAISQSDESAKNASYRVHDAAGKFTRRVIAFALVFGFILLCFFPGIFDSPAIVQTVKESKGFFFGLFPGGTKTEFHELNGFVHSPGLITGFGHVVAFYFGQAAAKP